MVCLLTATDIISLQRTNSKFIVFALFMYSRFTLHVKKNVFMINLLTIDLLTQIYLDTGAHIRSNYCYLICFRQLIRLSAVTNQVLSVFLVNAGLWIWMDFTQILSLRRKKTRIRMQLVR